MEYALVIGIVILGILIYVINNRSQHNKNVELKFQNMESNEEKMIILQMQTNKHLKNIDTTLDWFFWLFIIGFILTIISFFMGSLN